MITLFYTLLSIAFLAVTYFAFYAVRSRREDKKYIIEENPLRISKEVDFKLSLKY